MAKRCPKCNLLIQDDLAERCPVCGHHQLPKANVTVAGNVSNSTVIVAGDNVNLGGTSTVPCPDCYGTGWEHETCPECTGSGQTREYIGPEAESKPKNTKTMAKSSSGLLDLLNLAAALGKFMVNAGSNQNWKYITCPKCEGKGRIQLIEPDDWKCRLENTTVDWYRGTVDGPSFGKTIRRPCPSCSGFGNVTVSTTSRNPVSAYKTVVLKRYSTKYKSAYRYGIFIDRKKVGSIGEGEEHSIKIMPGRHSVKIDWTVRESGTVYFYVRENEDLVTLVCEDTPNGLNVRVIEPPQASSTNGEEDLDHDYS